MKKCGHYVKACVPDCDECVVDAMLHRCTKHARNQWLRQYKRDNKPRYERLMAMIEKQNASIYRELIENQGGGK